MPQLIHKNSRQVLAENVIFSKKFFQKAKGLLGYKTLKESCAMWIQSCSSIHTCFMNFPIDLIFVDKNLCIQCFYENVPPWKMVSVFGPVLHPFIGIFHPSFYRLQNRRHTSVFEFKAGRLKQFSLQKGDSIYVDG